MKKIYVDDYHELCKSKRPIGYGETANCFMGTDGDVVKIFYKNFMQEINRKYDRFMNKFEVLSTLADERIITPEKLIMSNEQIVGYKYRYIKAKDFEDVSMLTRIETLFEDYETVLQELKLLSDAGIQSFDMHGRNILYEDNKYYFIDFDKCIIDNGYSSKELYNINIKHFIETFFKVVYGLKPHQEGQFKNIDIRSYMNTPYFSLNDIKKLLREYEDVCGCKNPSLARIRRKTLKSKK